MAKTRLLLAIVFNCISFPLTCQCDLCRRYALAECPELSWLSPFAANITDCYYCCCAAAMAILCAFKSSCSLGPQTAPGSKH